MYELRFGPTDAARCRFVTSPIWETMAALRLLVDPRPRTHHLPWLDAARPQLETLDLAPLTLIQPRSGFTPDFPTPTPNGPTTSIAEELALVRATPIEQVRTDLRRAFTERGGDPPPAGARELLADPARTLARIADGLEAAWSAVIAPYWPRLRELFEADLAFHGRLLVEHGLETVLPALHTSMRWTGSTVEVGSGRLEQSRDLAGAGIILQPSAFTWPGVAVRIDEPWVPALVYPARGIAELWQPVTSTASGALAKLLGPTRAALLASLREPASTTTLARRHNLAPATVSEHLTTLRDARLVTARRVRRQVLYRVTELGELLSAG